MFLAQVELIEEGRTAGEAATLIERVPAVARDPGRAGLSFDVLTPLVSIGLDGRVRITDADALEQLLIAGGIAK